MLLTAFVCTSSEATCGGTVSTAEAALATGYVLTPPPRKRTYALDGVPSVGPDRVHGIVVMIGCQSAPVKELSLLTIISVAVEGGVMAKVVAAAATGGDPSPISTLPDVRRSGPVPRSCTGAEYPTASGVEPYAFAPDMWTLR